MDTANFTPDYVIDSPAPSPETARKAGIICICIHIHTYVCVYLGTCEYQSTIRSTRRQPGFEAPEPWKEKKHIEVSPASGTTSQPEDFADLLYPETVRLRG